MIRIMVADDHAGFRAGLRALLATAEGMEITAERRPASRPSRSSRRCSPMWC